MKTQGQDNPTPGSFVEISGKDADSIGISEGELSSISIPFHFSEGAINV